MQRGGTFTEGRAQGIISAHGSRAQCLLPAVSPWVHGVGGWVDWYSPGTFHMLVLRVIVLVASHLTPPISEVGSCLPHMCLAWL